MSKSTEQKVWETEVISSAASEEEERPWRKWTQALIKNVIVKKSFFKQKGKTAEERNIEGPDQGPRMLFDLLGNLFSLKQIG